MRYTENLFSGPANYSICVLGEPTQTLIRVIGQSELHPLERNGKKAVEFNNWFPDQTALLGLLNTLHDLHFAIVSIRVLADNEMPTNY